MPFNALFRLLTTVCTVLFLIGFQFAASGSEASFQEGIAFFQKGEFKQAHASFAEALKNDPQNPILLHNLAMTVQNEGQLGMALALWRKALAIQPSFSPAKSAIAWAESQLAHKEIPHDVTFWQSLRKNLLIDYTLNEFLGLSAVLLLMTGWLTLRYLGLRRDALLQEKPLPPFPTVTLISGFLLIGSLSLTAAKAYDLTILRGTIVVEKTAARSAADESATPLFDLYEGLEVVVRQTAGDWVQVTYQDSSTGWIPRSALFTTEDKATP